MSGGISQHDMENLRGIFVTHKDLPTILEKHGAGVGNLIIAQLKPELEGIHRELASGRRRFDKHQEEIDNIKIKCATQTTRYNLMNENKRYYNNADKLNMTSTPVDNGNANDDPEKDPTTKLLRKVLVWVTISIGVVGVIASGVVGIIMIIG